VVRPILAGGEFGVWQPAVYYRNMAPPVYAMPAMYPMRNRTHFLGVIGTLTSLANISSFLRQLEVTVNSRIFAVDSTEAIVATTHSTSFETFTETTSTVLLPGMKSNCAHSGSTSPLSDKYVIVCRTVASQFPWPPLQQAVKKPLLAKPGQGSRNVEKITTSDGTYYAASAGVGNQFRLFTFTLILLMPERDILGDIVTARNLVIGIVIAIFFVAVVISIAFTSFVLAPLRRVTAMMGRTARLRDVSDDSEEYEVVRLSRSVARRPPRPTLCASGQPASHDGSLLTAHYGNVRLDAARRQRQPGERTGYTVLSQTIPQPRRPSEYFAPTLPSSRPLPSRNHIHVRKLGGLTNATNKPESRSLCNCARVPRVQPSRTHRKCRDVLLVSSTGRCGAIERNAILPTTTRFFQPASDQ
jgi:hypothetical protein